MINESILKRQLAEAQAMAKQAIADRDMALTKLKEHEMLIQKAEKASQMKSLFLANMSHEIRTPLNAIEGFARVMAETDSPEERMKFLEIIESNNNRLQSLINEILDLSRVEAGELTIKKAETRLHSLCKTIRQSFKFRCPDGVKLVLDEPDDNITLITDGNRISQVYANLIGNALKHTTKGEIRFGYRLENDNKTIRFFVKDTGSGIAPEDLNHIFVTYVSRDAETTKNGHGLGLSLCKIIVERLGGQISVESELGVGSTFTFTLPFEGTITTGAYRTDEITNSRTLRVTFRPENAPTKVILVAEDEESNFQLVQSILGRKYRLVRALNGIEAVNLYEEEHPELILMDIRMPDMNGLDAARIIKEVDHDVPIVALSAYAFEENIRQALEAGCAEFMPKPFRVEDLVDLVDKYLSK